MNHILSFEGEELRRLHEVVFPAMESGNTILFLGAGASVGEKLYLSRQIMDLYGAKKGLSLDTEDIVDFVDTLSEHPNFDRDEFDQFVADLLRKLRPGAAHNAMASYLCHFRGALQCGSNPPKH